MTKNKIKNVKIHDSLGDRVLNWITAFILVLVTILVGYPLIYVISCSFSSSRALEIGAVILWPVDFSLEAYEFVLAYKDVWVGFRNSLFYCATLVFWDMATVIAVAYPLSRSNFHARTFYFLFFYISTRVGGGLIPSFILRTNLGLYDNIWAILTHGGISFTYVLILRTAIRSNIPGELHDAAMIDGANHFQIIFKLVIPLAKATLSVLTLYSLVGTWNGYFTAMIYLRNKQLYPLQLVLRPIMTAANAISQLATGEMGSSYQDQAQQGLENVRYALIIISTVPIVATYFVVQKYFKKGVMMGSLKG